ncbi:restriction endonuclease [Rhodococcus sp. NPDC078407]|uniref:restriction endonuclease n=1 Tax=Rhodococcus sp. NPDC078407 TaxID=3364509 RepID=UPI0037C7A032
MTTVWGLHNDESSLNLLEGGFVSIGWDEVGDLALIGPDRDALKIAIASAYPLAKPGAVPVWAGVLLRFGFEMAVGDIVVAPQKSDSTVSLGRITGASEYFPAVPIHRHRRTVEWIETGIARAEFSQKALYEIGSALTLFRVKTHAHEFLSRMTPGIVDGDGSPSTDVPSSVDEAVEWAEEEPNADKIDRFTRDFVAKTLYANLSHEEFEHFVADVLRGLGYRARLTQYSNDGGVDVIAHRDPLGLEPPLLKVQCKHSLGKPASSDVQQLIGALSHGELGLFVTLGTYSKDAVALERNRHDLRLVNGEDLVDMVLQVYPSLPQIWKAKLPLTRIYVVDSGAIN